MWKSGAKREREQTSARKLWKGAKTRCCCSEGRRKSAKSTRENSGSQITSFRSQARSREKTLSANDTSGGQLQAPVSSVSKSSAALERDTAQT